MSKEVRTDESKATRKKTGSNDFRGKKIEFRKTEISNTIPTALTKDHYIEVKSKQKIRRLTPLECWRLQDFPDEAFYKAQAVTSDSQLYRQAGNSITVRVIQKLIKNIYET
jgi:site-specific DNA-cytosine methylase